MSDSESERESIISDDDVPRKPAKKTITNKKAKVLDSDEDVSDESSVATEDDSVVGNLLESDSEPDDESDDEPIDENDIFQDAEKIPAIGRKGKPKSNQKESEDSNDEFQFGFESDDEQELEEEDDDGGQYLQKLDESVREQTIANHHPELLINNYKEVESLTNIVRDDRGIIIDPLHRTLPFLSKYERTRILGERAKQINDGAKAFVETDSSIIDGYLIALAELEQKKIPFIIRRPLSNGASEYWKLKDLEII